jgi:hypothetical protein
MALLYGGEKILENLAARGLNVPTRVSKLTYSMREKRKLQSGKPAKAGTPTVNQE